MKTAGYVAAFVLVCHVSDDYGTVSIVAKRKKNCGLGDAAPVTVIDPGCVPPALKKVPKQPFTPKQLARFLQVSPRTIARRVNAGDIPSIKIGTKVRFDPGEVLRYLKKQRPPATKKK